MMMFPQWPIVDVIVGWLLACFLPCSLMERAAGVGFSQQNEADLRSKADYRAMTPACRLPAIRPGDQFIQGPTIVANPIGLINR